MRGKVSALASLLLALGLAAPADACATAHVRIKLTGFTGELDTYPFWSVTEPGSGTTVRQFTIFASGDACNENVSVDYAVTAGTAQSPQDFTPTNGSKGLFVPTHGNASTNVDVTIKDDDETEPVTESVDATLTNPGGDRGATLGIPAQAPILVIDDDGASRVAFGMPVASSSETTGSLRVPVFRAGDAGASASVGYTLAPGGGDGVEPSDYTDLTGGSVAFAGGSRLAFVNLSVADDTEPEAAEGLSLSLVNPANTTVGTPSSTTATILDNEETGIPEARFHHPRQNKRYKKGDFRLQEMHIFTSDAGGSGVVAAQIALRKNLKSGDCAWWTGKRFAPGACGDKRWIYLPSYETDFFYFRIDPLRPSNGRIADYTAYARSFDGAGNVESDLDAGRNANTFEVTKPKKKKGNG